MLLRGSWLVLWCGSIGLLVHPGCDSSGSDAADGTAPHQNMDAATDADPPARDADAAECAEQCDPLTDCLRARERPTCGPCPEGYRGTGSEGCVPTLTSLAISPGTLRPAFAPDVTDYAVNVAITDELVAVTATAPSGAVISIEGSGVQATAGAGSVMLESDRVEFSIRVEQAGRGGTMYRVVVHRTWPLLERASLAASNAGADDRFGFSTALSDDILAVGAWHEDSDADGVDGDEQDNRAPNSGAVYVFRIDGDEWQQEAYLKSSNSDPDDLFGFSIALVGDTLAVGAYNEDSIATGIDGDETDNNAADSGAVYIFRRMDGQWRQEAYLKASNAGAGDQFGTSVALCNGGDVLVVGATGEDSAAVGIDGDGLNDGAPDSGAAYVFVRSTEAWSEQAYIKASNTDALDQFGWSVACSESTVAVSGMGEDSSATGVDGEQADDDAFESGAAYVFAADDSGTWSQQAYVKASNTDVGDLFGAALVLAGNTLLVSAGGEDSRAAGVDGDAEDNRVNDSGAVYAFARAGTSWMQAAYIKATNPGAKDFFGRSIALLGDLIAVGAPFEDSSAAAIGGDQSSDLLEDSGAVYLFAPSGGSWSPSAYLKASSPHPGSEFGTSLSADADTLAVGAVLDAPIGKATAERGSVFVFR
jgi:trimeric autotransporter adhesin